MSRLELAANHAELRQLAQWLSEVIGSPTPVTVELGVHEVACNVIDHARPADNRLVIEAAQTGSELRVTLSDRGSPFEGATVSAVIPGTVQERGYGVFLAESVTTALDYQRNGDENRWTMTFDLDEQPVTNADSLEGGP